MAYGDCASTGRNLIGNPMSAVDQRQTPWLDVWQFVADEHVDKSKRDKRAGSHCRAWRLEIDEFPIQRTPSAA